MDHIEQKISTHHYHAEVQLDVSIDKYSEDNIAVKH